MTSVCLLYFGSLYYLPDTSLPWFTETGHNAAGTIGRDNRSLLVDSDSGRSNIRRDTVLDHGEAVAAVGLVVYHEYSGDSDVCSIPILASFGHHTRGAICFFMLGLTISLKIHFGTPKNSPPRGGMPS